MTRSRQRKQARPGDPSPSAAIDAGGLGAASPSATTETGPEVAATGPTDETEGAPTSGETENGPTSGTASYAAAQSSLEQTHGAEQRSDEPPSRRMDASVPPPPARSPWPAALGGGVVGGILVGALAYYLLSGPRPDPALAARVAEIEEKTQQLGAETGKVDGLAGEVGKLQARVGSAVADPTIIARLQKAENTTNDALQQLHGLDTKVSSLAKTVDGLPKSQPDLSPLEAHIKAVEDGVAKVQAAAAGEAQKLQTTIADRTQALQTRLDAAQSAATDLGKKLDALESKVANLRLVGEHGAQLALAIGDAERALRELASLEPALERLQSLGGNDADLDTATHALAQASSRGITPLAELRQRLEALRPAAGPSADTGGTGGDWVAAAARNLGALVDVHEIDQATAAQRAAVDQALAALDKGDLASARDAIAPLARSGNEQAEAWVEAATTRLDAAAAIDRLRSRLQAILTAAS